MPYAPTAALFSVCAANLSTRQGRQVEADSFESAALEYLDDFVGLEGDGATLRVIVRDAEGGREHRFLVDLGLLAAPPLEPDPIAT